ncbi:MAG TPA: hypothetical protein ENK62_03315 [Chromatiales bacterium]|nr:hypothetical protein [Chromatiales bacterium]
MNTVTLRLAGGTVFAGLGDATLPVMEDVEAMAEALLAGERVRCANDRTLVGQVRRAIGERLASHS